MCSEPPACEPKTGADEDRVRLRTGGRALRDGRVTARRSGPARLNDRNIWITRTCAPRFCERRVPRSDRACTRANPPASAPDTEINSRSHVSSYVRTSVQL
jgi:hypothetical protein